MKRYAIKRQLFPVAAIAGGLLISLLINYHSYLTDFNLVPDCRWS